MLLPKARWVLVMLRVSPLDRMHIMRGLFLFQRRAGGVRDAFKFEPYLFGPCSFEVYDVLAAVEGDGLAVRPTHPTPQWVPYYLTGRGEKEAEVAARSLDPQLRERPEEVAQ